MQDFPSVGGGCTKNAETTIPPGINERIFSILDQVFKRNVGVYGGVNLPSDGYASTFSPAARSKELAPRVRTTQRGFE
jgi:hypothetical protein